MQKNKNPTSGNTNIKVNFGKFMISYSVIKLCNEKSSNLLEKIQENLDPQEKKFNFSLDPDNWQI